MNQNNLIETQPCVPKFVVDSWLLEDLVRLLASGPNEEACYITGVEVGGQRVLYRTIPVSLEAQSPVHARGSAKSCAGILVEILQRGYKLFAMAHSHPGTGEWATMQSSTDIEYLGRIQEQGAEVFGIIVSRDGYVRFFTVHKEFEIVIEGGPEYVADTVCKVSIRDKD